jgi:Protein of unknown function (DUF3047)
MPRGKKLFAAALVTIAAFVRPASARDVPFGLADFRVVERDSGPVNYYTRVDDRTLPFIHAAYLPPWETTVLGVKTADDDRSAASRVRWTWRAIALPKGGDECASGKEDSAAVVYLSWKRGLRYYALKYVWSSVGKKGAICDRKRSPFVAQDTVILESGGPLRTWKDEVIDLRAEFRRHFEGGDPSASVPDFVGIGIMSDGDQTQSESSADYARFVLER